MNTVEGVLAEKQMIWPEIEPGPPRSEACN
jgi:hypothetical protein